MPKFSIVIPIYNGADYLPKTISSVLCQSFKDFELILVDDGSTDTSLEICQEFARQDERVLIVEQENKGVSAARNNGLLNAQGEWLYFLDSDDTIDSNCLKKCSLLFNSNIDVIQFGARRMKNSSLSSIRQTLTGGDFKVITEFSEFINTSNIGALCVWLHVINMDVVRKNNISFSEDMNHNEDMLFMYKVLLASNKYAFIGETLHTQYLIENSLSRSPITKKKIKDRLLLVDRVFELIECNLAHSNTLKKEANQLLKWYFGSLLELQQQHNTNLKEFDNDYKKIFKKYKPLLSSLFSKLGGADVRIVVFLLKIKLAIRRGGSS